MNVSHMSVMISLKKKKIAPTDGSGQGIEIIMQETGINPVQIPYFLVIMAPGAKTILASFAFYFFSDFLIEVYLFDRFLYFLNPLNKALKNFGKWKENSGKVGICQSENVGTMHVVQNMLKIQCVHRKVTFWCLEGCKCIHPRVHYLR